MVRKRRVSWCKFDMRWRLTAVLVVGWCWVSWRCVRFWIEKGFLWVLDGVVQCVVLCAMCVSASGSRPVASEMGRISVCDAS